MQSTGRQFRPTLNRMTSARQRKLPLMPPRSPLGCLTFAGVLLFGISGSLPTAAQKISSAGPTHPTVKSAPEKAEQAYVAGARALGRSDLPVAQADFARAVTLDPARREYSLALTLTQERRITDLIQQAAHARITNHPEQAEAFLAQARLIDPRSELLQQHTESGPAEPFVNLHAQISPAHSQDFELQFAAPIQLAPSPLPHDLHLQGDPRQVVTQAAAAYGIKAVFDEPTPGPPVRFDLDQTVYSQAMPILLRMAHLFAVPVDAQTLLVVKDTQENRQRLERLVEETIYIPGSTTEQLNELSNIVKNVFDVKQVLVSANSGTLLLRVPASALPAVNYTLADLVDGGAEVMLQIQLLSLDKNHTRNTGTTLPNSVGAFSVASEAQNIVSQNQDAVAALISSGGYVPTGNYARDILAEAGLLVLSGVATDARLSGLLGTFGGGLTLFGVNYGGNAAFNLSLNSSESRALDDISVRVGDRQTTTLRIGSKYPITTSTYSSGVSGAAASLLAGKTINGVPASSLLQQYLGSAATATVPMVQFEDLGITLKTQPTVLKSGLVSLHIDLKIEALTGASANDIPVLTSRAFTSDITVSDGTTAVMLSDLSSTEAASVNGIPGLSELPGFQQTLADKLRETDASELVLLITPHLVRRRSNSIASRRISFSTSVPQEN